MTSQDRLSYEQARAFQPGSLDSSSASGIGAYSAALTQSSQQQLDWARQGYPVKGPDGWTQ